MLSVEIYTNLGIVEVATSYVPRKIGFLHFPDFYTLFRQDHPVYYLGDLNARCSYLGSSNDNPIVKQVKTIMEKGIVKHDGPYFPTFIT